MGSDVNGAGGVLSFRDSLVDCADIGRSRVGIREGKGNISDTFNNHIHSCDSSS